MDYLGRLSMDVKKKLRIVKIFVLISLIFSAVVLVRVLESMGALNPEMFLVVVDQRPHLAIIGFVMLYGFLVACLMPTLPFNLLAGYIWGPLLGGAWVLAGVFLGSCISFGLSRTILRTSIQKRIARIEALSKLNVKETLKKDGWKYVAFIRLNPVFPTGPVNYLLGISPISFLQFAIPTVVFLLPPCMAVAYLGHSLQTFVSDDTSISQAMFQIIAVSAVFTSLFIFTIIMKRRFRQNV